MDKSKNLKDKGRSEIVIEEVNRFKRLVEGHKKLLNAIGNL